MKVYELSGPALDWAVGQAHGDGDFAPVEYSTKWEFGGPIIEQEVITLDYFLFTSGGRVSWLAQMWEFENANCMAGEEGPTPLIAAMRCYVSFKLSGEVDVPEEWQ